MLLADLRGNHPLRLLAAADVAFDQFYEVLVILHALLLSLCRMGADLVPI